MLIRVVLAVDAKQVIGCAVCMQSILENVREDASVHFDIMTNGVSAEGLEALRTTVVDHARRGTIEFHTVDLSRFAQLMTSKYMSHTTYARLLIDSVLTRHADRCVYVDCDMVVQRDIGEAWEFPLRGCTVAVCANGNAADMQSNLLRLGVRTEKYFNAGFMVIDIARWREREVSDRAFSSAVEQGDKLVLYDQDALNIALQNDWVELPREWNAGVAVSDWLKEDSRAVFHYWGATKPWHVDYGGRFREVFFRSLDRTAFTGFRPWNPLGLGAVIVRTKRRIPHYPSVIRFIRKFWRSTRSGGA